MNTPEKAYTGETNASSFESQVVIDASIDKVFKAITEKIDSWWTTVFTGASSNEGDIFTARFGSNIFKTIRIDSIVPSTNIVWGVIDAVIGIPELQNQKEWVGTSIEWHLSTESEKTIVRLRHIRLTPQVECYTICESGWKSFLASLVDYVETGKGTPYLPQHNP